MSLSNRIKKEHLIEAFQRIDEEGIPKNLDSQYYNVFYQSNTYPPKLVVAYAHEIVEGKVIDTTSFRGGLKTKCFNILEKNGFNIVEKEQLSLARIFQEFAISFKKEYKEKLSKKLSSYQLLVKDAPKYISDNIEHISKSQLKVKGSTGQGVHTLYPWLGVFDPRVSKGATNGFYVVFLFSDDLKKVFLTFNQGSTQQGKKHTNQTREQIFQIYNHVPGFIKGEIPLDSIVIDGDDYPKNKGMLYARTNIFYKEYVVALLDSSIESDLKQILSIYNNCVDKMTNSTKEASQEINVNSFVEALSAQGIIYKRQLVLRLVSSLLTKPFLLLTGLSGSGKTQLAKLFAQWICEKSSQYCLVPVGADWTNRESLLGYPNALVAEKYEHPDNGALQLLLDAKDNPSLPYFLILDEMNLSHVERYFADFLSAMESKEAIPLHKKGAALDGVPDEIKIPENLFIIGTVNIDETTYMFSPKVLDRANTIEFRVSTEEIKKFFKNTGELKTDSLVGAGANMAVDFVKQSLLKKRSEDKNAHAEFINFFKELTEIGAEFGYRTANEMNILIHNLNEMGINEFKDQIDIAVMQKMLPKLHGSRRKLVPVLEKLANLCLEKALDTSKLFETEVGEIKYPLSYAKIKRMHKAAVENGFASYAEA